MVLLMGGGGSYEHFSKSGDIGDVRKEVGAAITEEKVAIAVLQTQQSETNAVLTQIADDLKHLPHDFDRSGRPPSFRQPSTPSSVAASSFAPAGVQ